MYNNPDLFETFCAPIVFGELHCLEEAMVDFYPTIPRLKPVVLYLKLLAVRSTPKAAIDKAADVAEAARKLANTLSRSDQRATPLTHHFVAVTAKTLIELVDFPISAAIAVQCLNDLVQAIEQKGLLGSTSQWGPRIVTKMKARLQALAVGTNLQHLADAAIGGQGAAPQGAMAPVVTDFGVMIRAGYLKAF